MLTFLSTSSGDGTMVTLVMLYSYYGDYTNDYANTKHYNSFAYT